jgi:energy-coupling factor transporter ATP-binding protein EcfA2
MRLTRFTGSGVHGFLKFDIKFRPNLTFLTGINGSGKTTAINAVVALITPDLSILSDLQFSEIRVDFENNGQKLFIAARSEGIHVILSASNVDQRLSFFRYTPDPDLPPGRQSEAQAEYLRELLVSNASHPIVKFISSFPTPMFLGLDRRARFDDELRRTRYPAPRPPRPGRNVFSASLSRSLVDAADLAEQKYRDALISSGQIAEELQRKMLLDLLTVESDDDTPFAAVSKPTEGNLKEIRRVRSDLDTLPQILRLPRQEVRKRVEPLLDMLEKYARDIPSDTKLNELFGGSEDVENKKILNAVFGWSKARPHLDRIKVISETVAAYNRRRAEQLDPTQKYLGLINGFLNDSGKSVDFNDRGYIYVTVEGADGERSISSLSSGEAQIFVILTHLAFNPLAQKDNVFIIDEPELSLHIQWQELFVDSILSANPNIQYVLSTHSPSIILERMDSCVDVVSKTKKIGKQRTGRK